MLISRKKRVVIDARLTPGKGGGVETLIRGLAYGFASAVNDELEFVFVVKPGSADLISQYDTRGSLIILEEKLQEVRMNCKLRLFSTLLHELRSFVKVIVFIFRLPISPKWYFKRDSYLESLEADVLHFPFQTTVHTDVPFVYHPHDLQHKYLPSFFDFKTRLIRDANYSLMCRYSALVSVASNWVKSDIIKYYRIPSSKIIVTQLAPLVDRKYLQSLKERQSKEAPPRNFFLYPAVNWPHKNHENLLLAIQELKFLGEDVRIVLTGKCMKGYESPSEMANRLEIGDRVIHLGHVSRDLLDFLYLNCRGVIVPTKFEAASFPVYEAQKFGKAVACSSVTSIPEQVGDSAILFNPNNVSEISESLLKLWRDDELVVSLQGKSEKNVESISWEQTCKEFIDVYRKVIYHSASNRK